MSFCHLSKVTFWRVEELDRLSERNTRSFPAAQWRSWAAWTLQTPFRLHSTHFQPTGASDCPATPWTTPPQGHHFLTFPYIQRTAAPEKSSCNKSRLLRLWASLWSVLRRGTGERVALLCSSGTCRRGLRLETRHPGSPTRRASHLSTSQLTDGFWWSPRYPRLPFKSKNF